MKVTTEECIKTIVDYLIDNEKNYTSTRDWKRVSKSGNGDNIIRRFENRTTGKVLFVRSSDSEIFEVSDREIVGKGSTINPTDFVAPIKRSIKCRCKYCGSTNILLSITKSDGESGYDCNPIKLSQKKAKKIVNNKDKSIWICLGKCEDETDVVVEIDNNRISDSEDFIEYIADYGNPKIDNIDILTKPNKTVNIIKAVKIGDIESVKEYIDAGNNLDGYVGDLPEYSGSKDLGDANQTFLIYAIKEQQYDVAIEFINAGCDVNKPMKHMRCTPLMCTLGNKYKIGRASCRERV